MTESAQWGRFSENGRIRRKREYSTDIMKKGIECTINTHCGENVNIEGNSRVWEWECIRRSQNGNANKANNEPKREDRIERHMRHN